MRRFGGAFFVCNRNLNKRTGGFCDENLWTVGRVNRKKNDKE